MKTYKHILVATNLTEESKRVTDRAYDIVNKSGAKLSIVYIIKFSPLIYGDNAVAIPLDGNIDESIQKRAQENLVKEGSRIGIPKEQQFLESGTTEKGLLNLIKKLDTDLLIIGSHEQHGLAFMLGSTANTMIHQMPCDVLAIHI